MANIPKLERANLLGEILQSGIQCSGVSVGRRVFGPDVGEPVNPSGGGGGFVFLRFLSDADGFHARLRCLTPFAVSAALSPAPHHDATLVITAVRLSAGIATLHNFRGVRSTDPTALVYCSFIVPVVLHTVAPPHATNARPSSVACSAQVVSVVP